MASTLFGELLLILAAGFVAGLICRRLGVSMLVGYLLVGGLIGPKSLGLAGHEQHDIEQIAEGGVLLLLFSIGLEFSLEDFARLGRAFSIGGSVQMALVTVPVTLHWRLLGQSWPAALLLGGAASLSSTVLVFRALAESGQLASGIGRRSVAILLFQDVALVPLLLLVPLVTGDGPAPGWQDYLTLAAKSAALVLAVVLFRAVVRQWCAPLLAAARSTELVVLFTMAILGGVVLIVHSVELPAAIGALAAGLVFSGNRLTGQVDAVILPLRETFAAVFFVSLGMLLDPRAVAGEWWWLAAGLVGVVAIKTCAAGAALWITGAPWRAAFWAGLGLSQLGEFSFVLALAASKAGVIDPADYQRLLAIALGTLVLTPALLGVGMRRAAEASPSLEADGRRGARPAGGRVRRAVVVGAGPIGRQVASQLETLGVECRIVDMSPVNLHRFAQQGFLTVAGDGADPEVLARADLDEAELAVVCVPDDQIAARVVRAARLLNKGCRIVARCRYLANAASLRAAGATAVVSEEAAAAEALLAVLADAHAEA